jgi:hypothetical protein
MADSVVITLISTGFREGYLTPQRQRVSISHLITDTTVYELFFTPHFPLDCNNSVILKWENQYKKIYNFYDLLFI